MNPNNILGDGVNTWENCFNGNANFSPLTQDQVRRLGQNMFLHEMAHHLAFQHLTQVPWMKRAPSCQDVMGGNSTGLPVPATMVTALKNLFTNFETFTLPVQGTTSNGQNIDVGLTCLGPDDSGGSLDHRN